MESGQATVADDTEGRAALDQYQRLSVEQVLADLTSLGVDELLLVESLEQASGNRAEVLDRVDELLDGLQGAEGHHIAGNGHVHPPAAAVGPVPVPHPSEDLIHQMGGLLERAATRSDLSPEATAAPVLSPPAPAAHDTSPRPGRRGRGRAEKGADPVAPPTAVISPDRGRRFRAPAKTAVAPLPPARVSDGISPRRRRRRVSIRPLKVMIGLLLVAMIGGAVIFFLGRQGKTSDRPPVSNATSVGSLGGRLVAGIPGYTLQPVSAGVTGPSNLARAAIDDGGTSAETILNQDGFLQGFQRAWTNTAPRQILMFVYQFKDASGATAYAQRWIGNDRAALKGASADLAIPGIPGAVGLISNVSNARATAVFTRGPYLARLVVSLPTPDGEAVLTKQLATQEYALL